jgi:F420-0:gamma-glutamyl ligase
MAPATADYDQLVQDEAQQYLVSRQKGEAFSFTITQNFLTTNSGVDESNVGGGYVLWPQDPQASANHIRAYLVERFGHQDVGVVITDSTCQPIRLGMFGMSLAHSGFAALNDYVGKTDLFDRPFAATYADVATGLAAAAVVTMGEGAESKPLALLQDLPFVQFTGRDPSAVERAVLLIDPAEDIFAPFLSAVPWYPGGKAKA